ncbi:hypothetical protein D3C71_1728600 [compost metagenome]
MLHAKHLGDHAIGERHRRQPQKAHHRRKRIHRPGRQRHQQKDDDGHGADEVDAREQVALGHALAQRSSEIGTKDVEKPDQRQRIAGHMRGQTKVLQVAGHVHADEHDLEAADEVARGQ